MGYKYRPRDSMRAEMYEKKIEDRVKSDIGEKMSTNYEELQDQTFEEIIERLKKVELQLDQLQLKADQLSSTLSQLCLHTLKEKLKRNERTSH